MKNIHIRVFINFQSMYKTTIQQKFKELFSSKPLLIRSPGRINLIGEHTDYNDGFVFPAAIDKEITFGFAKNNQNKFRFFAIDLQEYFEIDADKLSKSKVQWANYLLGVIAQYQKEGVQITGLDCVFGGNIPLGAGLSSSAALENGVAFAINHLYHTQKTRKEMAFISQKAEHEYAGVNCGIMDQFASMNGKEHQALKLDCRSLDFEYANINLKDYNILLCDTKVKHSLASSAYNKRRKECETGVKILQNYDKNIKALRDISIPFIEKYKDDFDAIVYKRCKFVIEENNRVFKVFEALQNNDIERLGTLMYQSHLGLQHDYEVSCNELDILFDFAYNTDAVIGARMMGGGFGGCTINLVKKEQTNTFKKEISAYYYQQTKISLEIYTVYITDGTSILKK